MSPLLIGGDLVLHGVVGGAMIDLELPGFSAADVLVALAEVGSRTPLTVRINSGGGVATEGLAVHAALSAHRGRVTTVVEGIAASAASLIAMAGAERVVAPGALVMVHDPSSLSIGTVADHAAEIRSLSAIATAMVTIYAEATGRPVEDIRAEMTAETWLTAEEAVWRGYATRLGAANDDEPAPFPFRAYAHAPGRLAALADARGWSGQRFTAFQAAGRPDPDPARTAARTAASTEARAARAAYVQDVTAVCALTGQASKATAYTQQGVTAAEIGRRHLDAMAAADAKLELSTLRLPAVSPAEASRASMKRMLRQRGLTPKEPQ